jgi:hypothetical protein
MYAFYNPRQENIDKLAETAAVKRGEYLWSFATKLC